MTKKKFSKFEKFHIYMSDPELITWFTQMQLIEKMGPTHLFTRMLLFWLKHNPIDLDELKGREPSEIPVVIRDYAKDYYQLVNLVTGETIYRKKDDLHIYDNVLIVTLSPGQWVEYSADDEGPVPPWEYLEDSDEAADKGHPYLKIKASPGERVKIR